VCTASRYLNCITISEGEVRTLDCCVRARAFPAMGVRCNALGGDRSDESQSEGVGDGAKVERLFRGALACSDGGRKHALAADAG